jgi:sialidase-1
LNSRNLTETRRRIVSRSEDGGLSWSDPVFDPQLQDPRNQGSLLTLPTSPDVSPPTVLLCNAAHETERRNLAVRLSTDGGRSWTGARTIEPGGAEYSSMTLLPDGRIGCLYEHSAEKLFHVTQLRWAQFPLEWLTGNQ